MITIRYSCNYKVFLVTTKQKPIVDTNTKIKSKESKYTARENHLTTKEQ